MNISDIDLGKLEFDDQNQDTFSYGKIEENQEINQELGGIKQEENYNYGLPLRQPEDSKEDLEHLDIKSSRTQEQMGSEEEGSKRKERTESIQVSDSRTTSMKTILPRRRKPFQSRLPKLSEIQSSIETLRLIVPEIFSNSFVQKIYQERLKKQRNDKQSKQATKETVQEQRNNQNLVNEIDVRSVVSDPANNNKTRKYYHQRSKPPQFSEDKGFFDMGFLPSSRGTYRKQQYEYEPKSMARTKIDKANLFMNAPPQGKGRTQMQKVMELDRIWNDSYESTLINAYKEIRSFSAITEHFKRVYPHNKEFFSNCAFRSKIGKIIRLAIKKFYNFLGRFNNPRLPPMKRINQNSIRSIVYNQDSVGVRILLLDVYLLKNYDEQVILECMRGITRYVSHLERTNQLEYLKTSETRYKLDDDRTSRIQYN